MISLIIDLIKSGLSFFSKKEEVKATEADAEVEKSKETNETNREDIRKTGFSARSILIIVLAMILAFCYIAAPLIDGFLGVPLFQQALDPIFKLLMALIVGS